MKPIKPNQYIAERHSQRACEERAATPPSSVARALRPFGYLTMALVWSLIGLVTLLLPAALSLGLWSTDPEFSSREFAAGADAGVAILFFLFTLIVLVPVVGHAFVALPLMAVSLAVLSWTYTARSLMPSYAGERLSRTGWAAPGDVLGPPTFTPMAVSLLPVRLTPWTRCWTKLVLIGWAPSLAVLIAGFPCGLASFLLPGWLFWPARGPVATIAWSAVTAALVIATWVLVGRAYRRVGRPASGGRAQHRSGDP